MANKMMIYYDITAWEELPVEDFDQLKTRCAKIIQLLEGLGVMSIKLRTEPEEQPPQQPVGNPNEQRTS